MSQTTQSPQTADFSALEVGGQSNDATIDYMQPISGSEQSDLGAYLAAPQPMMNTQGSSTPSRIAVPAPDDAPLLVGDTGVEYGPDISFGAYTQRLLGMGASVPINGIKNFAVGLWDMGAAIFRPSENLSNKTNFEYLDIDGSETYPEPGSGLTFDKLEMALSASINQSNENIRIAEASGNDWSVGWELGNHPLIQATGVGEFAALSLLSKAGGLVSNASIFNRSTRAEDVFDLNLAPNTKVLSKVERLEIQQALQTRVDDIRAELPKKLRGSGNVGVAQLDIPGLPSELKAHSRINYSTDKGADGFVHLADESDWVFKPKAVDPDNVRVGTPDAYSRQWDTEF